MSKTLNYLVIIFFLQSCGLKIKSEVSDNVLIGAWLLDRIVCYENETSETELERYSFGGVAEITLEFIDSRIQYTSTGSCSVSTNGSYITNFNGTSTGVLDIVDVETAELTCTETVADSGVDTVGNTDIITSLVATYSTNLDWLVTNDRSILLLEYYGNFSGSTDKKTCNGKCYCKALFAKIN